MKGAKQHCPKNIMKKFFLSLAFLIICGSLISQNVFNTIDHLKEKCILPTNAKPSISISNSDRAAGTFRLWIEPIGAVMANRGISLPPTINPNQNLFTDIIFTDSTVRIGDGTNTNKYVSEILLGSVLDPKSNYLQQSGDPIVSQADGYNIDSLMILGSYVKKTSAIDTLYTWLVWGDSANTDVFSKKMDNVTWNPPMGNWRHSIIGPAITGATSLQGNRVNAGAALGYYTLIKRVLTNSDSVGVAGHLKYISIALPTPAALLKGNIVSCFYTFVSGGSHVLGDCCYSFPGDAVTQNINGFAGAVWQQNNPAVSYLSDYVDQQVDPSSWCMGATYDKTQRYNSYPLTWSTFMPGNLVTAPAIYYSIYGTSTVGVSELETMGFALGQNTPNPFTNLTKINYQIKNVAESVTLQIFDIRGVKMFEKTQAGLQQGNYSVELNSINYSAGIYFYTLTVDGNKTTKKMIVCK